MAIYIDYKAPYEMHFLTINLAPSICAVDDIIIYTLNVLKCKHVSMHACMCVCCVCCVCVLCVLACYVRI